MSDGWRGMCGVPTDMTAGEGLLAAIRHSVAMADVECQVPATEPCFLRHRELATMTAVAYELLAQLLQLPGGAEQLAAARTRWQADPETCAANLRELVTRPIPTEPDTDDRPWPGGYL